MSTNNSLQSTMAYIRENLPDGVEYRAEIEWRKYKIHFYGKGGRYSQISVDEKEQIVYAYRLGFVISAVVEPLDAIYEARKESRDTLFASRRDKALNRKIAQLVAAKSKYAGEIEALYGGQLYAPKGVYGSVLSCGRKIATPKMMVAPVGDDLPHLKELFDLAMLPWTAEKI